MNKVVYLVVLCAASSFAGVPSCQTIWEDKCWDEPRQQCNTVQKPHSVTSSKEECDTEYDNKCTTVYDNEVDLVPRQQCNTIQVPRTESVPEQKCQQVPE